VVRVSTGHVRLGTAAIHNLDVDEMNFLVRHVSGITTGANASLTVGYGTDPSLGNLGGTGVFFRVHPATNGNDNWWCYVIVGSVISDSFDTGISGLSTTDWFHLRLTRQTSTSYTFYLNGVLQDVLTGPFPTAGMSPGMRTAGGTTVAEIDYFSIRSESMSPRFP
jgi:hypothetical protein